MDGWPNARMDERVTGSRVPRNVEPVAQSKVPSSRSATRPRILGARQPNSRFRHAAGSFLLGRKLLFCKTAGLTARASGPLQLCSCGQLQPLDSMDCADASTGTPTMMSGKLLLAEVGTSAVPPGQNEISMRPSAFPTSLAKPGLAQPGPARLAFQSLGLPWAAWIAKVGETAPALCSLFWSCSCPCLNAVGSHHHISAFPGPLHWPRVPSPLPLTSPHELHLAPRSHHPSTPPLPGMLRCSSLPPHPPPLLPPTPSSASQASRSCCPSSFSCPSCRSRSSRPPWPRLRVARQARSGTRGVSLTAHGGRPSSPQPCPAGASQPPSLSRSWARGSLTLLPRHLNEHSGTAETPRNVCSQILQCRRQQWLRPQPRPRPRL